MIDREELQYLAGFFDGEGSILLNKSYRGKEQRGIKIQLFCKVTNINKNILDTYHKLFGGYVYTVKKQKSNHTQAYNWTVSALTAESFLKIILPFLRQKKKEAEVVLKFKEKQKLFNLERRNKGNGFGKGVPYTNEEKNILSNFREQLFSLRNGSSNRRDKICQMM